MNIGNAATQNKAGVECLRSHFRSIASEFPDVSIVRSIDEMAPNGRYWRISVTHQGADATLVCTIPPIKDNSPFIDAMVAAAQKSYGASAHSITDRNEVVRRGFLSY